MNIRHQIAGGMARAKAILRHATCDMFKSSWY
jgi:hypothetical protein